MGAVFIKLTRGRHAAPPGEMWVNMALVARFYTSTDGETVLLDTDGDIIAVVKEQPEVIATMIRQEAAHG